MKSRALSEVFSSLVEHVACLDFYRLIMYHYIVFYRVFTVGKYFSVSRNENPRTVSGRERSSTKRKLSCAVRKPGRILPAMKARYYFGIKQTGQQTFGLLNYYSRERNANGETL